MEVSVGNKIWERVHMKFFMEYNYVPSIFLEPESFSSEYKGEVYESHFSGMDLNLSYLNFGFSTGFSF